VAHRNLTAFKHDTDSQVMSSSSLGPWTGHLHDEITVSPWASEATESIWTQLRICCFKIAEGPQMLSTGSLIDCQAINH
jgi:hypothetical protein